jgi:ATP-binding cassette subfamily B protein
VLELLQPLYLAWFVVGVVQHDLGKIVLAAGAFTASVGIWLGLDMLGIDARNRQLERVGAAFDTRIGKITASIPTLNHLESAEYLDQLRILRDQKGALGHAFNWIVNSFSNLIFVGGTIALATTADWRLLLVAAAGVPSVAATRWTVRWRAEAEAESAGPGRLARHLRGLGLSPSAGAEIRVFGLEPLLRQRLTAAVTAWRSPLAKAAYRQGTVDLGGTFVFFGVVAVVLLWMIRDTIIGTVHLDSFVLALMLVSRLQTISSLLRTSVNHLTRAIRTAGRFLWLLDYADGVERAHRGTALPPRRLTDGILIEDLSYTYAGAKRPALDNVSVHLPAGSVVALVGENGAGKSTLIKLLAGLYQPSAGRIIVDGVDLSKLDLAEWRARISGAFQDHARFELLAGSVVGIGDLAHVQDERRILQALKAAAADRVLSDLPDGLDTQLGSQWPGGVDLSSGQWQRLATARAMMRDKPLVLILDEPTAALDAAAEHELFERYSAAAREARKIGGITLLVTHRFSTVAFADLIIVLDQGRVTEYGSHAYLIAAKGQYAELYELQARNYR